MDGAGFEGVVGRLGENSDAADFESALRVLSADPTAFLTALRGKLPVRFLEFVGSTRPWSEDRRVAGILMQNPRTPPYVAVRLVQWSYWRDLANAAANPWISSMVRLRAEATLTERLHEMRLGEKVTLARLASPTLLRQLLGEGDVRILEGALFNPRLQESLLVQMLRADQAPRALFEAVAASPRWRSCYSVRRELALCRRTPLAIALAQITSLVPGDLKRVAEASHVPPLVRAAAARALLPRERNPRR